MRYQFDLSVPAATLKASPVSSVVRLERGRLFQVLVWFRPGPAGLVNVRIKDRAVQIIPANAEASLAYDDYVDLVQLDYDMKAEPFDLTIEAWSPNALFPHVITFGFDVELRGQGVSSIFEILLGRGGNA